jgi:hypothetical protein
MLSLVNFAPYQKIVFTQNSLAKATATSTHPQDSNTATLPSQERQTTRENVVGVFGN